MVFEHIITEEDDSFLSTYYQEVQRESRLISKESI